MGLVLILAISTLGLLALGSYFASGKRLLHPAVLFSSVWAADLLLIKLAGGFFYPLSPETLFLIIAGPFAFALGSWATTFTPRRSQEVRPLPDSSRRWLSRSIILIALMLPLAYRWLLAQADNYGVNIFMAGPMAAEDGKNLLVRNLTSLSSLIALIAFREGRYARLAVPAALILNLFTGTKTGVVLLIVSLLTLDWLKIRPIRWKLVISMAAIFALTFVTITIFGQKGDARADASLSDNLRPVAEGFVLYAVGGTVALDRVIREPGIVNHRPERDADFITVGPYGLVTNVYTIYFAYFDFGLPVTLCAMSALGFLITLVYRRALAGSPLASLIYGPLCYGLLMSIFAEQIFAQWNFLLRISLVGWAFYFLPGVWQRFMQLRVNPATAPAENSYQIAHGRSEQLNA